MSKRILVASDVVTHPILKGNQQCIMQYVRILRKLGFEVFYLYLDLVEGRLDTTEMQAYWGEYYFSYVTPAWQIISQKIRRRIKRRYYSDKVDVYYPFGLTSFVNKLQAQYHFDGLIVNYVWISKLAECEIPVKALFTHDVFADRNKKLGKKDAWYSFKPEEEAKAVARFSEVLSIQEEESEWFRQIAPTSHVQTVYSSFDFVEQPIAGNKNILFFSGGGELNQAGIIRFVRKVLPLLIQKDDDIRLLLGGGICGCFKQEELDRHIILKGCYDNPDDFYALGDICINPVFSGSGLKIKTFEALAHGKVTIVDPHSALGVYQADTIPLYRVNCPAEYVEIICQFLGDKDALLHKRQECKTYIALLNEYIFMRYKKLFMERELESIK